MRRKSFNWLLLILLILVSVSAWLERWDSTRPNWLFLPEMVHSVAYDAFAPNQHFADGKTLRAPVRGTIPRGWLPLDSPTRASNPYTADEEAPLARGRKQFQRFCTPCHGLGGLGDGAVAQRGYPPPPSLLAENARRLSDYEIFQVITQGKGNMPSHAAQISREDRWKVILHIRYLQTPRNTQPGSPGVSD